MGFLDFLFGKLMRGRTSVSQETEKKIRFDWHNINALLKQKGPSQLRQALLTADKDLDNALRDIVSGETTAERLRSAENRFEPMVYQRLWSAHKLRNNMVHEAGFEPPHFMLTEAVERIRTGLQALGVKV